MGKQFNWLFENRVRSFAVASKTILRQSLWLMLLLLGWASTAQAGTGVSQFDGIYTGNAVGTQSNGAPDSFILNFMVANGVVTRSSPPGTVSASGAITFTAWGCADHYNGVAVPYGTMNGQITITSSGGATVTGTWSAPTITTPIGSCNARSGTWTATRTTTVLPTTYALAVAKSGTGTGTVTSNPAGIDCGTTCGGIFPSGTSVSLTATPASGSYFARWGGACTGTGSCVVTTDATKNFIVIATFKPVPFVANTTSIITPTSATITTTVAFNTPDVGKQGAVYMTGWVPVNGLGALGISTANLNRSARVTATSDNPYLAGKVNSRQVTLGALLAAGPNTWVLVQKTASGWALVVNGQLIPYVTGVLGAFSSTQNILYNTDPSALPGAQFCVGYGTSDTEMIVSGRMLPVAIIPVANPTSTISGSCNVTDIVVVEFYQADINHYFMTASIDEAAFLDNKPSWGWARTGNTSNIWLTQALAPSNASPVCRFYGLFANGTVGSHFYTVDPGECEYVKGKLDWGWGYEGDAFYAVKPTGGACPAGTAPVYRTYNNGMGGAPNHRYMASQTDVDTMVSQGWVSEGTAFCGAQ